MAKRVIYTDKNMRELRQLLDGRFPLRVDHVMLSDYLHNTVSFHWHPAVEFAYVVRGPLICQANDTIYHLKPGDGVFFNANTLHAYFPKEEKDCMYKSVRFDPALLGSPGSFIYEERIVPILSNPAAFGLFLDPATDWQQELLSILSQIASPDLEKNPCPELRDLELLAHLWRLLYEHTAQAADRLPLSSGKDIVRMKQAMLYIQQSYGDLISLDTIAASCSLSQSECCRLFNRILHQSPMEYVISCRIEKSLPLLAEGRLSITEIAGMTGFQSSSYFAETFKKQTGMTPSAYRKEHLNK